MRKHLLAALLFVVAALALAPHLPDGSASAAKPAYIATKGFTLKKPNDSPRLVVVCPRRKFPYGSGMTSNPPPDRLGEGVYPHSYERLGVQGGWHVTPVLFDPAS
jgi:hypothetical protein